MQQNQFLRLCIRSRHAMETSSINLQLSCDVKCCNQITSSELWLPGSLLPVSLQHSKVCSCSCSRFFQIVAITNKSCSLKVRKLTCVTICDYVPKFHFCFSIIFLFLFLAQLTPCVGP